MSTPPVTVIVNAFARVAFLAEVLECYFRQDYAGEMELLIVNDFLDQNLRADSRPGREVTCLNLPRRARSLGEKRNIGIVRAKHEVLVLVDDDDITLPWSVSTLVERYLESKLPTWAGCHLYSEGFPPDWHVTRMLGPSAQHCLLTKWCHLSLGGFRHLSTSDDVDFMRRAEHRWGTGIFHAKQSRPDYVYRWATGTYHLAGISDSATSWERAYLTALDRVGQGLEPAGDVIVEPSWRHDYVNALAAHV